MGRPRQKSRHVLVTIAALLLVSAGLRFGTGAGPAVAYAQGQASLDTETVGPEVVEDDQPINELLEAIQAREDQVSERETAINDRLLALTVAEEELRERLTELEAAEASLAAALVLSETANDNDIARLTAVYENMKPADAAGLFEEMAPEFASGFLIRMRPEIAAAIMAGLEPQTAYSISALIAGRNANAPTE